MACSAVALAAGAQPQEPTYRQKTRTQHTAAAVAKRPGLRMIRTLDAGKHTALLKALPNLPTPDVTVIADADGVTWVGTTRGAVRFSDGFRTREYFAGRRWLPDDRVTGIALDGDRCLDRNAKGCGEASTTCR